MENCKHENLEYHGIQFDEDNKPIFLYNCHDCKGTLTWKEIYEKDKEFVISPLVV